MKIILIGGGKVGSSIVNQMVNEGHDIVVIDSKKNIIAQISDNLDVMTLCGNGAEPNILREAGVQDADLVIACTAEDELNALWKRLRTELPPEEFQPLLEEQRAWIAANGREVLALMDQGCTKVEACTRVTEARIENLSRRFGVSEASFRIPAGRYGQSSFASRQTASRIQDKPDQEERPRVQAQPWRQAGQAQPGGGEELSWQASRGDEGVAAQPAPRTNNEVDDHDVRMLRLVEEAGQDFAPE